MAKPERSPAPAPRRNAVVGVRPGRSHADEIPSAGRVDAGIKRLVDVVLATALLALAAPVFAVCSVALPLATGGSPIYRQLRCGRHGRWFWIYKFRTMRVSGAATPAGPSETTTARFKLGCDLGVTAIGRVVRTFSVDELPQLINVLKGDMSLVGPRPFSREVFMRTDLRTADFERWLRERHRERPGMTGLWQVSGRSDLPAAELIRLDLLYVERRRVALDLWILCRTIPAVVLRRGAY